MWGIQINSYPWLKQDWIENHILTGLKFFITYWNLKKDSSALNISNSSYNPIYFSQISSKDHFNWALKKISRLFVFYGFYPCLFSILVNMLNETFNRSAVKEQAQYNQRAFPFLNYDNFLAFKSNDFWTNIILVKITKLFILSNIFYFWRFKTILLNFSFQTEVY